MFEVIDSIQTLLKISFYLWINLLFFASLKKCFWKEGKSKAKLFFLSLITGPEFTLFGLVSFFYDFDSHVSKVFGDNIAKTFETPLNICACVIIPGLYLALTWLYVHLISKWLCVKEKNSVLFVYLMFNSLSAISLNGPGAAAFSIPYATLLIDIAGVLVLYFASWLMFRLDISSLAKMVGISVKVNWRIFTIPPAVFIYFYTMLVMTMMLADLDGSYDGKTALILYVFSSIICFLLIWAFHVIIKNINATDEALKAKEEAVQAKEEVKELSVEVMEALAHTIDAKDEYTRGHSVRVANYSRTIAEKMGLSAEECENTYYMGLLHDLGKIGVPNEIINSPTKLTDDEYAVIKKHPGLGFDILSEIKSRPDLVIGARWHHERYDGKGYPDGKSGEEIPLIARIIAVADSYDAMTSNRSYRKYMPQDKVRSEIEKNAGSQFDPKVAQTMLDLIDEDKDYVMHE